MSEQELIRQLRAAGVEPVMYGDRLDVPGTLAKLRHHRQLAEALREFAEARETAEKANATADLLGRASEAGVEPVRKFDGSIDEVATAIKLSQSPGDEALRVAEFIVEKPAEARQLLKAARAKSNLVSNPLARLLPPART